MVHGLTRMPPGCWCPMMKRQTQHMLESSRRGPGDLEVLASLHACMPAWMGGVLQTNCLQ